MDTSIHTFVLNHTSSYALCTLRGWLPNVSSLKITFLQLEVDSWQLAAGCQRNTSTDGMQRWGQYNTSHSPDGHFPEDQLLFNDVIKKELRQSKFDSG